MRRTNLVVLVISLSWACGGASASESSEAPGAPPEPPPAAFEEPAPVATEPPVTPETDGQIRRAELDPVLEAGLGRFLQGVETEPATQDGRFVGFRLLSLYPEDERMQSTGLEPGDVITSVNGQPIERPEQALRVWNGLRVASELLIEYQRDGESRELRFEIVD